MNNAEKVQQLAAEALAMSGQFTMKMSRPNRFEHQLTAMQQQEDAATKLREHNVRSEVKGTKNEN